MLPVVLLAVPACHREFERCRYDEDCNEIPPGATQACLHWDRIESAGFCTWSCESDQDCASTDYPGRVCAEFDPFDHFDGKTCVQPCDGPEDCGRGWGCGDVGGSANPELACYP